MRPRLPDVDALLPYLRRIDGSRIYSNWGPLTTEFEKRLSAHFGLSGGAVVSANSGTSGLVAAILAVAGRASATKPLAIVPAFTFVATAVAAEQCGYQPFLADVDPGSWMLDPERLLRDLDPGVLARTGVVVPVSAFGRPVLQAPWQAFRKRSGIPVAIDGAASFEAAARAPAEVLGEIPVVMSFHATKSLTAGEGGCVVLGAQRDARAVVRALNFGFFEARESTAAGINGKMSEYHAAVGLAALDTWDGTRAAFLGVADGYRRKLGSAGLGERFHGAPEISSCYALFHCADAAENARVTRSLQQAGIDHRLWYGTGLLNHAHFSSLPHERLVVTDDLAPCLIGLPMAVDLQNGDIGRIVDALTAGLAAS